MSIANHLDRLERFNRASHSDALHEMQAPRHPEQPLHFVRVGYPYRAPDALPERATVRGVVRTLRVADIVIAGLAITAPLLVMAVML
jgi:hypothetical protein